MTFSFETGVMFDKSLKFLGDSGYDFEFDGKKFDIKGTQYFNDPHLKQYPNPKNWVDYYLLAGINTKYPYKCKIFGWTDKETIQNAPLKDYGYGSQRSLSFDELNAGMPNWLPSMRKKYNIKEPLNI